MKTNAAILWEVGADWSVEEIELDPPGPGEVLVKMAASGMCHSDEHLVTGDLPFELPMIGGHEGAGMVQEVGEGRELAQARRPRRVRVHPLLWSVPELLDGPPEPLRPRRGAHGRSGCRSPTARPATTPRART